MQGLIELAVILAVAVVVWLLAWPMVTVLERLHHDRAHAERGNPHRCGPCYRLSTQFRMTPDGLRIPRPARPHSHRRT